MIHLPLAFLCHVGDIFASAVQIDIFHDSPRCFRIKAAFIGGNNCIEGSYSEKARRSDLARRPSMLLLVKESALGLDSESRMDMRDFI